MTPEGPEVPPALRDASAGSHRCKEGHSARKGRSRTFLLCDTRVPSSTGPGLWWGSGTRFGCEVGSLATKVTDHSTFLPFRFTRTVLGTLGGFFDRRQYFCSAQVEPQGRRGPRSRSSLQAQRPEKDALAQRHRRAISSPAIEIHSQAWKALMDSFVPRPAGTTTC